METPPKQEPLLVSYFVFIENTLPFLYNLTSIMRNSPSKQPSKVLVARPSAAKRPTLMPALFFFQKKPCPCGLSEVTLKDSCLEVS